MGMGLSSTIGDSYWEGGQRKVQIIQMLRLHVMYGLFTYIGWNMAGQPGK